LELAVPTYEYRCNANGTTVEVQHKMAEQLSTWGELCDRAGIPRGKTSPKARVEKLMSAGFVGKSAGSSPAAASCEAPMCGSGACGGGMCGMN
jgi:predicted nucleic acid-binding Zn ribbon protein